MKPVLTFVLGALLASALAVFLVKRDNAPAVAEPSPIASAPAVSTPLSPAASEPLTAVQEPVPVHRAPIASEPSRVAPQRKAKASRPSNGAPVPASTPVSSQPPPPQQSASAPQSNTSTSVTPGGGPPQTTLHMPPPPAAEKPIPPPRVAKTVTIPAGTLLSVRVDETLSSSVSQSGDSFRASLDQPLVIDGAVVAEKGARVEGRVAESDRGGRVRGTATLALELLRLNTSDGQRVRLQTEGFTKMAERSAKKDAAKIGIGAGLGAAIGAIAGGGKGAAIGAGVGGAAGTGAVMGTRGAAAEIPAETRLTFRLQEPITVTEKLK